MTIVVEAFLERGKDILKSLTHFIHEFTFR